MIINQKNRAIVLNLRDPQRVLDTIPSAKPFPYRGHNLTVVKHRTPNVRILQNMGIDAPLPIDHYYDWPIRPGWTPMAHQKETARFLTRYSRAYCLNDLGTAKTLSSLWAFDFLRSEGTVKKLLVIAPLSTLALTWGNELFFNFPHLRYTILHHSDRRQRIKMMTDDVDVYIINIDGIKVVKDELLDLPYDCVIIDELSQAARNAKTDRWKALKEIIAGREIAWGMTGTPTPNEPTDAWAQCKLLTPETVPNAYSTFRDRVMHQVTQFKWTPKPNALDEVYRVMQPAIRFKRTEVIDLPPVMYETHEVGMTTEQQRAYDQMVSHLEAEARNGMKITAVNEAVKLGKLVQICAGAAYNGEGETVAFPPTPRIKVLEEIIEEAAGKVIVFVPVKGALKLLAEHLSKRYSVATIFSEIAKKDRERTFRDFQTRDDPRVLVAQPASMSHGLTLTAASVIVWFAPINSTDTYDQANARISRSGQKNSQFIIHLQGTRVEAMMYERLKTKSRMQGVLLEMFDRRHATKP